MKNIFFCFIMLILTPTCLLGFNVVTNGEFEQNILGWYPYQNDGSHIFGLDNSNPIKGSNSIKVNITNGTSNGSISENWRQGVRWPMSVVKDGRYILHFKARASQNLKLVSMFQQNFSPYLSWGYVEWNLTTNIQSFDVELTNDKGVGGFWAFVFNYGHLDTGSQIWIDEVRIEEIISLSTNQLSDGNICNGDFENNISNLGGQIAGWETYLVNDELKMSFEIDSIEPINGRKSIKITNQLPLYEFKNYEKVFGFDGQNRYAYCPSIVKLNDGTVHMYFCGNPQQNIMVDNIYHIRINPDGTKTKEKSVLQPGISGSWDDHHTCDPSVIAGEFILSGIKYKYAMFFLTNKYGVYYNEIGVAFSNDLEADSWVKYSNQIVKKTWISDGDQLYGNGGKSWGVGQPSAISNDGKGEVLLTYTIGDIKGTRIAWSIIDMSNMDNFTQGISKTMIKDGLKDIDYLVADYTCNSDFAIDKVNNILVMARPVQPHPASYPTYLNASLEINYISLTDFKNSTGKWTSLLRISPATTKYPRNHNGGIERNIYGEISDWQTPMIYYTVSKASPDVSASTGKHAEWTYHIWRGKISKN